MTAQHREREMFHFEQLTFEERKSAILRLASEGASDYTISAATGIAVEQIRRIIGERQCNGCEE